MQYSGCSAIDSYTDKIKKNGESVQKCSGKNEMLLEIHVNWKENEDPTTVTSHKKREFPVTVMFMLQQTVLTWFFAIFKRFSE